MKSFGLLALMKEISSSQVLALLLLCRSIMKWSKLSKEKTIQNIQCEEKRSTRTYSRAKWSTWTYSRAKSSTRMYSRAKLSTRMYSRAKLSSHSRRQESLKKSLLLNG